MLDFLHIEANENDRISDEQFIAESLGMDIEEVNGNIIVNNDLRFSSRKSPEPSLIVLLVRSFNDSL